MFERLKLTKRLEEHEDRLSTAERRLNALTMEWADTLDRMKRMMGRLSKDRQRIEEIQPTPDETLGETESCTMSYYQGDFYQGDPGFFSSILGMAGKAAGFLPGVGSVASTAIEKVSSHLATSGARKALLRSAGRGIMKHPVLSAAGGAGALGLAGMGAKRMMRGKKMPAGLGRRRRRMNVCNPRALRRSIRRTHGFAKLAMRTIHLIHPRKKVRFGGFRKRRKAA